MKKMIIYVFLILIFWFVVHTLIIAFNGLHDRIGVSDVAVVLGNKVELNGSPSKRLQGRLDKAAELYDKKYFDYIIVSGGIGKEGFDESAVMKEYLIKKGIPSDNILLDPEGYNTFMTAKNAKIIMDNMGLKSVMIISQFYHITRTKSIFQNIGFEQIYSAHSTYYELRDVYSLFREFFAYYKYLLL